MAAMLAIHPYRHRGVWVFDDPTVGLKKEPFVHGADALLDRIVEDIPGAGRGFTLRFSAAPFRGRQFVFEWRREDCGGNWYYSPDHDLEGWLCPALFRYFETAPERIYVQASPLQR
jgi:hypothetical protein